MPGYGFGYGYGLNQAVWMESDFLIDRFPATAAYSLRALSSSTTNVVRVREDGSNTEQDFTAKEITDGTLASFCGANNGFVVTWYDQAGSNDATQATAGSQPKIYDSSTGVVLENGKPAVDFDGTVTLSIPSSVSTFKFLHDGTSSTFISVSTLGKIANPSAYYSIIANNDGSSAFIGLSIAYNDAGASSDAFLIQVSKGVAGSNVISSNDQNKIIPATQSLLFSNIDADNATAANRSQSAVNGSTLFGSNTLTNAPSTANASYDLEFGGDGRGGNTLVGYMQEIIIYNSDQSANRTAIEGLINSHYSIYP